MNKTLEHHLQRTGLISLVAIVILSGMMLYIHWSKSPNTAVEALYINRYSGTVKEIIILNDYIQDLKAKGYNKPLIRKSFYNNRWDIYADFYKYSSTDGSVEDVKTARVIFSLHYSGFGFTSPKIKSIYSLSFSE